MTREVAEAISEVRRSGPVVQLEEGKVWISGMNARPWDLARNIERQLEAADVEHGETTDDGAEEHGGLLIPVPECEPISEEVHAEVLNDATEE